MFDFMTCFEKKKPTSLGKFSHLRAKEGLLSCAIIACVAFYNQQWAALNRLMKAKAAFRCCSCSIETNDKRKDSIYMWTRTGADCKLPHMSCYYVVAPGKEKKQSWYVWLRRAVLTEVKCSPWPESPGSSSHTAVAPPTPSATAPCPPWSSCGLIKTKRGAEKRWCFCYLWKHTHRSATVNMF